MKEKVNKLKTNQIKIILLIRFIEPLSVSFIFPFAYFMIRDLLDENKVGFYVGYITSSFAIAQLMTSVFWGYISDRFGRKPIIILGLIGNSISLILFGFSRSLIWAFGARFLAGLLNGNIGILKSMITELTDHNNRGISFGPILGGYLSNPSIKYPLIFENLRIFKEFPYLLPCAICSLLCLISALFCYFYLEETLKIEENKILEEDKVLLDDKTEVFSYSSTTININYSNNDFKDKLNNPSQSKIINKKTYVILIGSFFIFFLITFSNQLLPLWAATPLNLGGLNFDSKLIGNLMTIEGVVGIIIQLFLYPKLQKHYGLNNLYILGCFILFPLFLSYPLISDYFMDNNTKTWMMLIFLTVFRMCAKIFCSTGITLLISENSFRENLGIINGLDMSMRALAKSISPITCGIMWSWSLSNHLNFPFDYHTTWYFLAIFSFFNYFVSKSVLKRSYI